MLLVCKRDLSEDDFDRLAGIVAALPYRVRWARRAGRLVLLLEHARGDAEDVRPLAEDDGVAYVLRDPSEDEIARIFSRRDLLNVALGTTSLLAAAVLGGPVGLFLATPGDERSLRGDKFVGRIESISPNSARTLVIDGEEFLIIRRDETHFSALAATCTHSEVCSVKWDPERRQLVCPCHRGVFDVQGNVVSGPPPRPLHSREVVVRDGSVYVKRARG